MKELKEYLESRGIGYDAVSGADKENITVIVKTIKSVGGLGISLEREDVTIFKNGDEYLMTFNDNSAYMTTPEKCVQNLIDRVY